MVKEVLRKFYTYLVLNKLVMPSMILLVPLVFVPLLFVCVKVHYRFNMTVAAPFTLPALLEEKPRETPIGPQVYDMGPLQGRKANSLYADFIGYKGHLPQRLSIDWDVQLNALWERKLSRGDVTPVARQIKPVILNEYATLDQGRMTLVEYQRNVAIQTKLVYDHLDWDRIGKSYFKGNKRKLALLKQIAENTGGRSILAYAMAELFPLQDDGMYNRMYLDFLLQHAGRRYFESLPAIHDGVTSFGPWQFTEWSLFDTPRGKRGASIMNQFLPSKYRVPGSVMLLRGDDHPRAAYLLALDNLANLIASLDKRTLQTFERIASDKGLEIVQYIAVAHNKPTPARRYAAAWLTAGGNGSFETFCRNAASRGYALKTRANFRALEATQH